jgi:cytochrome o ubiquinol oxidase subunit 2
VQKAKTSGGDLNRDAYVKLAAPSENDPVAYYATVEPGLYRAILTRCVDPESPSCMTRVDLSPHESGDSGAMLRSSQASGMAAMAPHSPSD